MSAIDVSNHQAADLSAYLDEYHPAHVVVKLYQTIEVRGGRAHAKQQLASAREHGCTVGGYLWLYASVAPRRQVEDALSLAAEAGVILPVLWLDVEPYTDDSLPSVEQITQAVEVAQALGARPGIYTGAWVWPRLGNPTRFAKLPLWTADYNGRADLDVPLYGGWEFASGHQYRGDPLDLNVFLASVTE